VDAHADHVVSDLLASGVAPDEIVLRRDEGATLLSPSEGSASWAGGPLVWAELANASRQYTRLSRRFGVYMACAGIIAAIGILTKNSILVVGAMAISPDLLPLCAACVGIAGRRAHFTWSAVGILAYGFACATVSACLTTVGLRAVHYGPVTTQLGDGGLGILPQVSIATVVIAAAAGVAGMLAFETRAGSAVGVAISVTTIPAASYIGVAAAVGEWSRMWSAGAVLLVNVLTLLASGALTLALQKRVRNRGPQHEADHGIGSAKPAGHRPTREDS
jgi:uncharacterized hydrophobic protein (TIGR00271 family)